MIRRQAEPRQWLIKDAQSQPAADAWPASTIAETCAERSRWFAFRSRALAFQARRRAWAPANAAACSGVRAAPGCGSNSQFRAPGRLAGVAPPGADGPF